jgi:hypothetical protein
VTTSGLLSLAGLATAAGLLAAGMLPTWVNQYTRSTGGEEGATLALAWVLLVLLISVAAAAGIGAAVRIRRMPQVSCAD